MSKIIKWSLILGTVSCVLGVGMIAGAASCGAMTELSPYLTNEQFVIDRIGTVRHTQPSVQAEITAADEIVSKGIRNLEIEAGPGGTVELVAEARTDASDDSVRIVRRKDKAGQEEYRYYVEESTLKIELPEHLGRIGVGEVYNQDGMEGITIYVRDGFRFGEAEIETKAGGFYAETLNADRLSLEASAGSIEILGGSVGTLEADAQAGRILCDAAVKNGAEADCKAGSIELTLSGTKNQYDYEIECHTGAITLGSSEEDSYSGLNRTYEMNNGTGRRVELECYTGKISVNYRNEED